METEIYRPKNVIRFVTASSLFDGHDASINIMRRLIQAAGCEVIHLGHNRSVEEIVTAALQEDVQAIAVSSYQGGHMEFFKYMYDLLRERGAGHVRLFGGGGGVIVPEEIKELEEYGICRIYSPEDGRRLGLQGMISDMVQRADFPTPKTRLTAKPAAIDSLSIAQMITAAEQVLIKDDPKWEGTLQQIRASEAAPPVIGITGTGGAGKSSLVDEVVRRFLQDYEDKTLAIISIDPSRQKTGGALLGDRIRMNAIHHPRVYMRSLATRKSGSEISDAVKDAIAVLKAAGFDAIIVETSGIGQGNARIVDLSDISVYVMTSEFGAPSQLEKIDMLDYADFVVINKFERRGSEDALRDVRKQYRRNHNVFDTPDEDLPIFGTVASRFNDYGTNVFYKALADGLRERFGERWTSSYDPGDKRHDHLYIIPPSRTQYLSEIVLSIKDYKEFIRQQVAVARKIFQLEGALEVFRDSGIPDAPSVAASIAEQLDHFRERLHPESRRILDEWPRLKERYSQAEYVTKVRDTEIRTSLYTVSLSGTKIPKVSLPPFEDYGEILRWVMTENIPGQFPFTAGVFPFKREGEDPKRQFAGEGTPERTNNRFHYLAKNDEAKRLSTAFDSVTLYGSDPDYRPDIYGKVGESGVSICTLEDMQKLYAGFDLCAPSTSVSMTINGPAPIILAMFMNTAILQQVDRFRQQNGREPSLQEYEAIKAYTLRTVRGTVQADILKEDQGQNTCIFSTEFSLRMMGDIQQYFIDHDVRNYYSVSISGYHIAEAGANPISQLAFTLSNAFTYVEYYLARGMHIDDFAPNLSFFFSHGMDPEYSVLGRVARRIWSVAIKNKYGGNDRSQKLKYHTQTSGRSLHAMEIAFNDIRTTLQALMALYDNCNSLHTNAYDEAITTPSEESVRRAVAIQMIITKELGLAKNENPMQGAFIIEELTDLVEEAVLAEFMRINDRGGVLGAMETQYQRGKIQDESMYYEMKKHNGELPIIGVNTFIDPTTLDPSYKPPKVELARASYEEKETQIRNLGEFHQKHAEESGPALERLQYVALSGGNIFAELIETVKYASLGQITQALFQVGGKYRRNM